MDMRLELASVPPGARPVWLTAKTIDGRVLEMDWDDALETSGPDGTAFLLFGLHCPDDNGYRPDAADMDGASLMDASWRDADGEPFGGKLEILSAVAEDPEDDGKYPLSGTPLALPALPDYGRLDRGVRDMVRYLNTCGILTRSSYGGQGLMRIAFHRSVTEQALRSFPGGMPLEGRFCFLLEPDGKKRLSYVAATPAAVSKDLDRWKLRNPVPGGGN